MKAKNFVRILLIVLNNTSKSHSEKSDIFFNEMGTLIYNGASSFFFNSQGNAADQKKWPTTK